MKKLISALLMVAMLMSVVSFSVSADEGVVYLEENFTSMESLMQKFIAGAFFIEDGLLFGYKEARALQSLWQEDDNAIFIDTYGSWLAYDVEMTLAIAEDEFGDVDDRHIAIAYCNDHLKYEGQSDDRVFMNFNYSVPTGEFTLTAGGVGTLNEDDFLDTPVANDTVVTDGSQFFKMGMSVSQDRIRCYFNDELIFDFTDPSYMIARNIVSPVILWNTNNFVQVKNITVTSPGHLYPFEGAAEDTTAPVTEAPAGDDTQAPAGDDTQAPAGDDTQAPAGDDTQAPAGDDTNAPAADDTNAPAADGTDAPAADAANTVGTTGTQKPSTSTGDASFVVVAAMVAALGSALIVRKVRG